MVESVRLTQDKVGRFTRTIAAIICTSLVQGTYERFQQFCRVIGGVARIVGLSHALTGIPFFLRGAKVVLFRGDRAANQKASSVVMLPRRIIGARHRLDQFAFGANVYR